MGHKRKIKDSLYEEFATVGKAMGHPKRFELLDLLSQGPRTVERLAGEAALSIGNASHHLQGLKEARLVESQKDGLYVTYRLTDGVETLLGTVRRLAERHRAEVDRIYRQYFASPDAPEPQDKQALLARVRGGEAVVIDVRPVEEYAAGHLEGALSIPLAELEQRLSEFPADKEIVAYCRGRYCVLAVEAVERLVKQGYGAMRLEESVQDLRNMGFRIVSGENAA
jgi:rhodanese-related sulfurtransferase/DNA-binding transcriptional ArsR family regulator